ncbi:MAG: DUF3971 domain-containing protein [Gammaproteobacteria bacterium]|nr:DUF3971 domain-containing protein [Gammaproteobacteria bacterium]
MNKFGGYLGLALVSVVGILALISTALRVVLLTLDDVHPYLSHWASEAFEVQMEIGQAVSEWRGVYPSIILDDVTVKFDDAKVEHRFDQVALNLDLLKSLFSLSLIPERISVSGGAIRLQRLQDGQWGLEGMPMGQLGPSLDFPVDHIHLRKVATVLFDQKTNNRLDLGEVDMDMAFGLWGLEVLVRKRTKKSNDLSFELQAEFNSMNSGNGIIRLERMRLAQLLPWLPENALPLAQRLPANARLQTEAQLVWEADVPQLAGVWIELEQSHSEGADWQRLAAALKWRTLEEGYAVALEQLELDQHEVADGVYIEHGEQFTRGYLTSLDIKRARQVAGVAGYRMEDFLPGSITSGTLSRLAGEINWGDPLRYRIHAGMEGLEISMPEQDFQVTGLDGTVGGSEQGIRLSLDSKSPTISYAPWHLNEFRPGLTKFQLDWWPAEDCCAFRLTDLQISSPALQLRGDVSVGVGELRKLYANLDIGHADLATVSQWVPPGLLLEADDRWVRSAFKAGRLSNAHLRLTGPLSPDMFAAAGSELTLDGSLNEVDLDYEPGLPIFKGIDGEIFLDKASLHFIVREAKIKGSSVSHGALWIDDLGLMDMHSSSVMDGPVSDVPEFLEQIEWMAPMFNQVLKFGGNSTLDLQLNLALDERLDHEPVVKGVLKLPGNQLDITVNDVRLDTIKGNLKYGNEALTGSLDAQFAGHPARIGLATASTGDLQIKMQSSASIADYMPREIRQTFSWLEGHSAWNLEMLLPGVVEKSRRDHLTILASSDFRGITIDLPEPLGKMAKSEQPIQVKADIEFDGRGAFTVEYVDRARAWIQVTPGGEVSGTVNLGSEMPQPRSDSKLILTGSLPETSLQDWIDWREQRTGPEGLWPRMEGLELGLLKVGSFEIHDAEVSAQFAEEFDRFAIDAPIMQGVVDLPKEEGKRARGAFNWLRFSESHLETVADVESTALNPQSIPPLDLKFKLLQIGPYEMHDATLVTSPGDRRLTIDKLQAKSHEFDMNLSGYWELENGKHLTLLEGKAHTDDLHETLNHWSVKNPLRKGVIDMDVALQWPGAPQDYEFKNLQGYIDINGKDGRIRNVAPELARILALLNLEMIFKRLSLDFDDVVRGGFTYETAKGKFDFLQGHLNTSEFRIIGPSAQFLIIGRIGVEDEDYDLTVVATPETSALLPVLGAVGGPLGVAGVYVGNKVLEWLGLGIDDATAVTYKVTGPWSDPIIEEISEAESDSKE